MSGPKPIFVGESNPFGCDPGFALYPEPPGCAGHRLCKLILQLEPDEYLERFDRANLCRGDWSMLEARKRAEEIANEYFDIVILGAKVAKAFDLLFLPYHALGGSPSFTILPHPSGLNRLWTRPRAFERARAVLKQAAIL